MIPAQVITEENAVYFSVYNNGDLSLPICANCPIDKLELAKSMYDHNFTIRQHSIKYNMNWVIGK